MTKKETIIEWRIKSSLRLYWRIVMGVDDGAENSDWSWWYELRVSGVEFGFDEHIQEYGIIKGQGDEPPSLADVLTQHQIFVTQLHLDFAQNAEKIIR